MRRIRLLNAVVFVLSVLAITGAAISIAGRPALRLRVDATGTRAYSLSPQTVRLLEGLEDDWTIAAVLRSGGVDEQQRQQIAEVLDRYRRRSGHVEVVWIDPDDPADLVAYDRLVATLTSRSADGIERIDAVLDRGEAAFADLMVHASQQAGQLGLALQRLPAGVAGADVMRQRLGLLGLLADEGGQVLTEIRSLRRPSDARPVPDHDGARSILATSLMQWARELDGVAETLEAWADDPSIEAALRRFARAQVEPNAAMAGRLATIADELDRLPTLELSAIGRRLAEGESLVVIGPERAAAIPREQLLPRVTRRTGLAVDRRFRGEQVISATMRSLTFEHMPTVVFVHTEGETMLRGRDDHMDLTTVAELLAASRFEVREWIAGVGERPAVEPDRTAVWVIVPPTRRARLEPSPAERAMLRATHDLIAEGEPVLLSLAPSLLPRFDRPDPWGPVLERIGVEAELGSVVAERLDLGEAETAIELTHERDRYTADHPIAAAVHGLSTSLFLPIPLRVAAGAESSARVLATIEPSPSRWIETRWAEAAGRGLEVESPEPLDRPVPIVIAVERTAPAGGGLQRAVVVGSGLWTTSRHADVGEVIGGQPVLRHPGNQELLLASVAWLAGLDELIARSPISQQIARLDGITGAVWLLWFAVAAAGMPLACLGLSLAVWSWRRR